MKYKILLAFMPLHVKKFYAMKVQKLAQSTTPFAGVYFIDENY